MSIEITASATWENGRLIGEEATCPICGEKNFAPYGPEGRLIWWPSSGQGRWCPHCKGVYQGWKKPVFRFG